MQSSRWTMVISIGLLAMVVLACELSASTANISSVKIGKDKGVGAESTSFGPNDSVYAVASIGNAMEKVKVKGRVAVEEAEGQPSGMFPGTETVVDLPGSGTATFTFIPPASGWPKGKYKVEVMMLNDKGEQKDQKTISFTVS
jgi:hypothetical protein